MYRLLWLLLLLPFFGLSQSNVDLRGDSLRAYKVGGSMEFVLRNKTKDSLGVLSNISNGVTAFLRPKLVGNTLIIGRDTLSLAIIPPPNNGQLTTWNISTGAVDFGGDATQDIIGHFHGNGFFLDSINELNFVIEGVDGFNSIETTDTTFRIRAQDISSNRTDLKIEPNGIKLFPQGTTGASPGWVWTLDDPTTGAGTWEVSGSGGGTVTAANSGLTLNSTTVQLGQTIGAGGNPGELLHNTEIPLNSFSLAFNGSNSTTTFNADGSILMNTTGGTGFRTLQLTNTVSGDGYNSLILHSDLSQINFEMTNVLTNGFASLTYYTNSSDTGTLLGTSGYDYNNGNKYFIFDMRGPTLSSTIEDNGTAIFRMVRNTRELLVGIDGFSVPSNGLHNNVAINSYGSIYIRDSFFLGKIPHGTSSDSIVLWHPGDSSFRKVAFSSVGSSYTNTDNLDSVLIRGDTSHNHPILVIDNSGHRVFNVDPVSKFGSIGNLDVLGGTFLSVNDASGTTQVTIQADSGLQFIGNGSSLDYINAQLSQGTPDHVYLGNTGKANDTFAYQSWVRTNFASSSGTLTLTNSHIFVGNSSNVATDVAMSGNVTISNTGVTTIGAGVVTNSMLAGSIDLTAKVIGILPIANGGTNVGSVTIAPTVTAFAGWDANKNLSANNFLNAYATTATAAGTTTLVVGSASLQYFTGSTTQTVKLPVATTLVNGFQFVITNNSTGVVTVQTSGTNTIQAMASNTQLVATVINTAGGTSTASWNWTYVNVQGTGSGVLSIVGTTNRITVTGTTTATIDISASYVGQTSITTLGTITTGVWNGTAIANANLANSSTTINGTAISLGASGTVTAAAGTLTGTTLNSTVVTSSLTSVGTLTTGTASTGFVIGGVTMTLGSDATGDIYYRNVSGVLTRLGIGTAKQTLHVVSGLPAWVDTAVAGGGAISSVSNSDGTLTISPTTGAVVASIALGHANTWTATQTFSTIILSGTGGTNPEIVNLNTAAGFSQTYFYPSGGTNIQSALQVIPKGTGQTNNKSQIVVWGTDFIADASNYNYGRAINTGTTFDFQTANSGTGVLESIRFYVGATTTNGFQVQTDGNITFGTTTENGIATFAGNIAPEANNTRTNGTSSFRWSNSFSVLGNFSGVITNSNMLTATGTPTVVMHNADSTLSQFSLATLATKIPTQTGSVASADLTAQSATVSSVATVTPAANGTFRVGAYATITAISAGTLTITVTYTDETSTSRTVTFFPMGLSSAGLTATGATAFSPADIRAKSGSAITVVSTFSGVSITYDIGTTITQLR